MKPERLFYSAAGSHLPDPDRPRLAQHYIFQGKHFDGTPIDPSILATVVVHSSAIFALVPAVFRPVSADLHPEPPAAHETWLERTGDFVNDRSNWTTRGDPLDTPLS